jgi:hypothetical protein
MKKFNWKKFWPAFLTGASWMTLAILYGLGVPLTLYSLIAPLVAQATGIILGIIWTPAVGE